jgi:alpha-1,6-mannosyltransferase
MIIPQARPAHGRRSVPQIPLRLAGTTGVVGSLFVLVGVAQRGSPFVSNISDAWFFGIGHGPSGGNRDGTFLGVLLVYAGVALMIGSWYEVVRTLRRNPAAPVGPVVAIAVAWSIPVLAMPPLFSRDVYSYAAQGDMVSQGINPYAHGPTALGPNPYLQLVDPIWQHARAPYGPAWERLSGGIVQLAHHHVIASIVGFRLAALVGMGLMAWGVPVLARTVGRDPTTALALAVLNPLVLLVLLGGAHNDALMLGLLVAGCAVARRHHPWLGLVLCALAAEVKIPALIGAVFIGWWWSDGVAGWRQRLARVAGAVLVAVALMAAIGLASGLGWRWLDGLSNPGVVVSWGDPVTAVGLSISQLSNVLGFGAHSAAYVDGARAVGIGVAAVVSIGLILRSTRLGPMQALGWSLLAFVVLGPVVWPWYETWGFVFLAVIAEAWTLRLLLALSAIACFADLPGLHFWTATDPMLAIAGWLVLVGLIVAYGVIRLLPSIPVQLDLHSTHRTTAAITVTSDPGSPD